MFSGKSKKESLPDGPAGSNSTIGGGTTITGDIESASDLRIDGTINGNVSVKGKLLVGPEGVVNGDIQSQVADILGRVNGKCQVHDLLQLRGKGNIQGDIHAAKLQVEPTASFNGHCHTGASVVQLAAGAQEAIGH
ncbi:MAG: polymer-forming cytoskeletal protein [Dinghuibacter sp.]|nr:polymer-forming cytoskeletal protein [Dinghuibacter sp.]